MFIRSECLTTQPIVSAELISSSKSAIDKMIEDAETLRSEFFKEEINTCKNELDDDIINQDQNNNVNWEKVYSFPHPAYINMGL